MKAISIHQPWAGLIAQGRKTIETRWWETKYRGPLLICSTKRMVYPVRFLGVDLRLAAIRSMYPLGMALATVDMIDCRVMFPSDEDAAMSLCLDGLWAWVLANTKPLAKPFPVRGHQGFYNVNCPPGALTPES